VESTDRRGAGDRREDGRQPSAARARQTGRALALSARRPRGRARTRAERVTLALGQNGPSMGRRPIPDGRGGPERAPTSFDPVAATPCAGGTIAARVAPPTGDPDAGGRRGRVVAPLPRVAVDRTTPRRAGRRGRRAPERGRHLLPRRLRRR